MKLQDRFTYRVNVNPNNHSRYDVYRWDRVKEQECFLMTDTAENVSEFLGWAVEGRIG